MPEKKVFTVVQADGLYPDETVENAILRANLPESYEVNYKQLDLFPTGVPDAKPWSDIPADLREKIDGIMVLKLPFTAEDLALFPRLKV
ncbi:hypothetical protein N7470_001024 [Penicillium chermesinum]|nr:hypothetical protein N7470_001024 [Penicillium chermesinum]